MYVATHNVQRQKPCSRGRYGVVMAVLGGYLTVRDKPFHGRSAVVSEHGSFLVVSSRKFTFSSALHRCVPRIPAERGHTNLHIFHENYPYGQNSPRVSEQEGVAHPRDSY